MNLKRWFPYIGMIFLTGLLLDIPFLMILSLGIAIIFWIAKWWSKKALDNIEYTRIFHYTGAFPGEEVQVTIDVKNNKLLPVSWLKIRDPWPKAIGPVELDILISSHLPHIGTLHNVYSLRWFEKIRRNYILKFRKRGAYRVGPANLESGDMFGIYENNKKIHFSEYLTVFPELIPIEELNLPADDPFGDRKSRRKIFEDPSRPMGIREYRPQDGFRQVHWPATARTGELKVKVFQPTSAKVLMACMNASTFPRNWEGYYPELFEYLVSVTASIIDIGMQNGYQVGMISNGTIANSDQSSRITPARSPRHLANLLGALAGVTPFIASPFEQFLMREMPRVPYGATLVILSAVVKAELIETLVRIKNHGRRIVLISLAKDLPPVIKGIHIIHIPFEGDLRVDKKFSGKRV